MNELEKLEPCDATDCLYNSYGFCQSDSDFRNNKLGRDCSEYIFDEFERR